MKNSGLPNVGREATALIYSLTQHSIVRMASCQWLLALMSHNKGQPIAAQPNLAVQLGEYTLHSVHVIPQANSR